MDFTSSNGGLVESNPHGMSAITACLFIVGEIAGTGILALPDALKSTGWTGLAAIIVLCAAFAFSGILLGKCWLIVEERDEQLRHTTVRIPFSLIAERAGGAIWEKITTISLIVQMFGGAVVVMLILAEIVERLAKEASMTLTFCSWIMIISLILLPFTYAGSPVDFKPVAVSAMSSTSFAALFLIIEVVRQNNQPHASPNETFFEVTTQSTPTTEAPADAFHVTAKTYILGLSTMAFAFAGASAMPTFQQDMRDRSKFTLAAGAGFALLLVIYVPVAVIGYAFYGDDLKGNIVRNLNPSVLTTIIDCLMAIHIFSAYLIIINPVNLWLEHVNGVTHSFNFARCFSRTVVHAVVVLVGLSIPKFGKLLNLVGALCVCLQSVILPCILYYKLQTAPESTAQLLPLMKALLSLLTVIFTLIAIAGTILSLEDIFSASAFTEPCWISNCDKD